MMLLPVLSVNPSGTVSDVSTQSMEETDMMDEEITKLPSTIPQLEGNAVLSDTPEIISYVSSVVTNLPLST